MHGVTMKIPLIIFGLSLRLHMSLTLRSSDTPFTSIFHYSHRSSVTYATGQIMVLRFPVIIYTGSSVSIVIRLRSEFLTNVFLFPMGGGGKRFCVLRNVQASFGAINPHVQWALTLFFGGKAAGA